MLQTSNIFAYWPTTSSNSGTQTPKQLPFHSCWQSHLYPLSQCSTWGSMTSTLTQKSLKNRNIKILYKLETINVNSTYSNSIFLCTYQLLQSQHPYLLQVPSTKFIWVTEIKKIPIPIISNGKLFIVRGYQNLFSSLQYCFFINDHKGYMSLCLISILL